VRLAVRLAFFPRLDASTWERFQVFLTDGLGEDLWFDLVKSHVLENPAGGSPDFPSYGHDTRHAAAWRWFVECDDLAPRVRREVEALVFPLAAECHRVDKEHRGFAEALRAMGPTTAPLNLPARCRVLPAAAECLFAGADDAAWAALDAGRKEALAHSGAVAALLAHALVNRGVRKGKLGDTQGEIADYTATIGLPGAAPDQVAHALYNRGVRKGKLGDTQGEIADYTAAVELPGAPPDQVATALVNRGVRKGKLGDTQGAIADYTAAVELPGAPPDQVAKACANLGMCHQSEGRAAEARRWLERALTAGNLPDKGELVRRLLRDLEKGTDGPAAGGGDG
jgi:tetratricopeptide (TPR) repeat protein